MPTFRDTATNRLLSSLSKENLRQILSACEQVELVLGDAVGKPGERMSHVYFPIDSVISLMMPIDSGASLEVALVGNEGMYGIPLVLGVEISPVHAMVQGSGRAWRMEADKFHNELRSSPALQQILNRYVYVSMSQLAQTAACNRFHLIEERLARWILMIRDRVQSDEFYITHESVAGMLGVRRVGVTNAAGALQQKNLIHYSRGRIKIIAPLGLEAASCSCYQSDKEVYARFLQ